MQQKIKMPKQPLDSLSGLYNAISNSSDNMAEAILLLELRSWFTNICDFEPRSGHEIPQGLDEVLQKIQNPRKDVDQPCDTLQDRLFRIVKHIDNPELNNTALRNILKKPRDRIIREHALMPIYAAREVDSVSIQWLSKKPGRNIREKLSGKPYIKAVRRRNCVDTAENRLLKAFLHNLEDTLFRRDDVFKALKQDCDDDLLLIIQRWFRSDESADVGLWGNIPPNNTLLQDKNYRKIWDAWLWLQRLDDDIESDYVRRYQDLLTSVYWSIISTLKRSKQIRLTQQPIVFDYDSFELSNALQPLEGYYFPPENSLLVYGKIKSIIQDKKFGFIKVDKHQDLFFHASDLSKGVSLDRLKQGDPVSFILGRNNQGDCAKEVKPRQKLLPAKLRCQCDNNKVLIAIGSKSISFTQADIERELQMNQNSLNYLLKEIPNIVLKHFKIVCETTDLKHRFIEANKVVIDLRSIRPIFTTDSHLTNRLPFRLLLQKWQSQQDGSIDIDCATSNAIQLSKDIKTNSMYSLFTEGDSEEKYPEALKRTSAMFFAEKISNYLKVENLTYLVPDAISEFSLESIRKSINFYYPNASPLPRSIAAIFDWQSSRDFQKSGIKKDDVVTIIDINKAGYSLTPVVCKFKSELKSQLAESKGIYWERHPTVVIKEKNISQKLLKNIQDNGFSNSEKLIDLFGVDGLVNEAGQLSFSDENLNWYDLPKYFSNYLANNSFTNEQIFKSIQQEIPSIQKLSDKNSLFLLPLSQGIKKTHNNKSTHWLPNPKELTKAGLILADWQTKIEAEDGISLWRDHLPELSIQVVRDGISEKFFLVKDTTVTPMRGKVVVIPVKESFTLPAGQSKYSFPLNIGEGDHSSHNVAELRSPAFPLISDTECRLKMTYTYGADEPYVLRFIPLDIEEAGFKSVKANWGSIAELPVDLNSLPIPSFPERKSWADFQRFPKENGTEFSDLLDWVKRDIDKIVDIRLFFQGSASKRQYNNDVADYWNWKEDKNGNKFCYLKYDSGDVFFHESNFEKFTPEAEKISFDKEKQKDRDGYVARNITTGRTIHKKTIDQLKRSLRFPVLTIWNNGHSLSEYEVPDDFRNTVSEGTGTALTIMESENIPNSLKEELFLFLSCLHKDTPLEISQTLLEHSKDKNKLRKYQRNIAFAIGTAELEWQQELLSYIIDPIDNEGLTRSITLEILAVAFWRVEELVNELSEQNIKYLIVNLLDCLEFDLKKLNEGGNTYQIATTLCRHLELSLALLRTRKLESESIKSLLAPNNPITKKYSGLIGKIIKLLQDKNIKLNSRIELEIDKPEHLHKTPDLLYALNMYLTGDSGANAIVIKGVSDD